MNFKATALKARDLSTDFVHGARGAGELFLLGMTPVGDKQPSGDRDNAAYDGFERSKARLRKIGQADASQTPPLLEELDRAGWSCWR